MHDSRYFTKAQLTDGQTDVVSGAVRTSWTRQGRLRIPAGYALVVPDFALANGAELMIADGAELTLVG